MTIQIEYEAELQLQLPYEEIIEQVVIASLDTKSALMRHRSV